MISETDASVDVTLLTKTGKKALLRHKSFPDFRTRKRVGLFSEKRTLKRDELN